jgi:SpoVK/Ycf46/Vps4 family AAA+-type ATPase
MTWRQGYGMSRYYWILAESSLRARQLFVKVCQWNSEVRGEVLVYNGGCWQKDAHLFQAIKGSTFDNLVLRAGLKQSLRDDIEQFFTARPTYEAYKIPWKRGMLLVGPPGNGKTHVVKAIINALGQPCLYVKSVRAEHSTDEDNIREVFERARKTAPCILVLEDLDSLLTPQNRSFFLNELDGFAANIGIVTLATTNHPERLDPSILDRPSRFDRKYPFNLPELPERVAYIRMWNANLQETLRLADTAIVQLAEATDGFSFAYLKELFLSAMMRWITHPELGALERILINQVRVLREQMMSAIVQAAESQSKEV